jgi:DNA modification methylase
MEALAFFSLRHFCDSPISPPADVLDLARADEQRSIPGFAKNAELSGRIEQALQRVPTQHRLIRGDSRQMRAANIPDASVHLVVTSPPYWTLKKYPAGENQLGYIHDYDAFLVELDHVWREVLRVLVPGGRLVVVLGDVCLSRRRFGRLVVFPLQASIQEHCRAIGFDNLAPIIWNKIANAQLEVDIGSSFLGKPYEPNAVVKNDIEYILFQRKPGGYRQPTLASRVLSIIPESCHRQWFQQVWKLGGASTRNHPAPFPLEVAERLVRMFSFAGDTVLDPFAGTATTNLAAGRWGRNSIGLEVEPAYIEPALRRLEDARLAAPRPSKVQRCDPISRESTAQPGTPPSTSVIEATRIAAPRKVQLLEEPRQGARITASVLRGAPITVVKTHGVWSWLQTEGGQEGWAIISTTDLQRQPPEAS